MRRALAALGAVAVVALATASSCTGGGGFKDVEGIPPRDPDSIQLYNNVDSYPNVVKLCIQGVAFATTTRDAQGAIMRVPEWDRTCPAGGPG